ncbi:adenosylhomocysteinase-like [Prosopis cineraria]|uniref:adenosylhomocysteinase-like n=1 Tax=Prosopis cineraria TaxID=364024 RepID=UPI00240FCE91|nr:adenosylhomocysteinase-like [Prosopis cineraria]
MLIICARREKALYIYNYLHFNYTRTFSDPPLTAGENYLPPLSMADSGRFAIQLAEKEMPQLMAYRAKFRCSQPYKGLKIADCGNLTAETAVLVETYTALGADVLLCSSTPQDHVAAAIIARGSADVFPWPLDWGNGGVPHLILGLDEIYEINPVGVSKEMVVDAKKLYDDVYMTFSKNKMGLSLADHGAGLTYEPGSGLDDDEEVVASPSVANLGTDDHHESTNDIQPEFVSTLSINGGDHTNLIADDGIGMSFDIMEMLPRNLRIFVILVILLTVVAGMVSKFVSASSSFGST